MDWPYLHSIPSVIQTVGSLPVVCRVGVSTCRKQDTSFEAVGQGERPGADDGDPDSTDTRISSENFTIELLIFHTDIGSADEP